MKLRNAIVVLVALGLATTVVMAQTGGFGKTVAAVQAFFDIGPAPAHAGNAAASASQSANDFSWRGRLATGQTLEIKGVNGGIEVDRAPGDEVVVTAEMRARRSDRSSVRIERVEHADGMTFCAVYPTPEGQRANRCGAGSEGRMNTNDNDVVVDFTVLVPRGVTFVGRTVNGDIDADDLASDVRANTVNGGIKISTTGYAQAQTVNGSIELVMGSSDFPSGAEFSTVNGSIDVDLPDDVNADIEATWLNGGFESDLPFTLSGGLSRRSARGVLGAGGPQMEFKTVNGSIRIR